MPGNNEDRRTPPRDGRVYAETVGTSATEAIPIEEAPSVNGPIAGYFTFEARNADIYIVFGPADDMDPPTATANGFVIPAGQQRDWYLTIDDQFFRALATESDSTLLYARSS